MTCSTCTCHEILQFVVFLSTFFKSFRWESHHLCLVVKLGICSHVGGPVSRDRRILVMEMEVGKAVYLAYSIFTTDILTQFLYYK